MSVSSLAKKWIDSPLVRRYAANAGWMLATRAAWILSAFTVGIYVARRLGPFRFGLLSYAIALTGVFSIITTMSVEEFVIRQLVHDPGSRDRTLGNFFMLRVALYAVMSAALGTTLVLLHATPEFKWLCVILATGYLGFPVQGGVLYFQATVDSRNVAIPQLVSCVANTTVRAAAAYFNWPLAIFALAEAGNHAILFFGSLFFYWRLVDSPLRWNWRWAEIWSLFKTALPLAICSVFSLVYARTDQLMVENFLGPRAVGYYSLSARFTENWAIVAHLLCLAFFPAVISAAQVSERTYRKQLHRLYFLVFWSMAAAALLTTIFGRPVILLFFGAPFLPTVPVLRVFTWTLLGTALLDVFSQWAINEKRLSMIAWSFGSGAVLNVVLNPLLIKIVGINGAAWSSLVSMPIGLVLALAWSSAGRTHLFLFLRSVFTFPSLRLDLPSR